MHCSFKPNRDSGSVRRHRNPNTRRGCAHRQGAVDWASQLRTAIKWQRAVACAVKHDNPVPRLATHAAYAVSRRER